MPKLMRMATTGIALESFLETVQKRDYINFPFIDSSLEATH
jgi:hypothetical protein